jgi:transcriptional/translational regulatory protein YebC/TACO1
LEADADNVEPLEADEEDGAAQIGARFYCDKAKLDPVTKALKAAGWTVTTSELAHHAKDFPELSEADREEVTKFLQTLDEHPDVHRVYAAMK